MKSFFKIKRSACLLNISEGTEVFNIENETV